MKSLRIGMLMCLMFFVGTSLARFVEVGGQVVMEAENYDSITPDADFPAITWQTWDQGTGPAAAVAGDASGGKYLHIENEANPSYDMVVGGEDAITKAARVSYNIEITTAGTYYLWARGVWPVDPGNTVWFSVDATAGHYATSQVSRDNTSNPRVWVWWSQAQDALPNTITLTPGSYTFSIHQRERRVNIDKLILTRTAPTGNPIAMTPALGPDETFVPDRGFAHTPVPVNGDNMVDSTAVTSVSWYSPLQDETGAVVGDPNIVSVNGYNVYFRTTEPNDATDTPKSTNQAGQSWTITPALAYDTTYYWRVDTSVTWDSNSFTGAGNTGIMKGVEWKFTTKPFYREATVKFDNVRTALTLLPAVLAPEVTLNTNPITSVTFTLLTDDFEYPAGANASVTNTTTNNQTPTATLTTDTVGKYKVKVAISDGITAAVEKIAEVMVYVDACAARKATAGWTVNYFDRDGDCLVDEATGDLSDFVLQWLDYTGMTQQMPYTKDGVLRTADIVIEAENVYDANNINYVSEPPLETTAGNPRIMTNDYASGGKNIGYTANTGGTFLAYQINVPTAGAYTVYVMNAFSGNSNGRSIAFGTVTPDGDPANDVINAYGSVILSNGTGTGGGPNYLTQYKLDSGTVTFTTAGPQIVRVTWVAGTGNGNADVDFIALKKN